MSHSAIAIAQTLAMVSINQASQDYRMSTLDPTAQLVLACGALMLNKSSSINLITRTRDKAKYVQVDDLLRDNTTVWHNHHSVYGLSRRNPNQISEVVTIDTKGLCYKHRADSQDTEQVTSSLFNKCLRIALTERLGNKKPHYPGIYV